MKVQALGDDKRLERAQNLHEAVADLAYQVSLPSAQDASVQAKLKVRFSGVLGAIRAYENTFGRRGLVPGAELKEGSIRPYNLQPKGGAGKLEHEHIIPGALFAAWLGLDRPDSLINAIYRSMTTLTWKYKAARIKTTSDGTKWRQMQGVRDAWLALPDVARELRLKRRKPRDPLPDPSAVFGPLESLKVDRVSASIAAAAQAGSKVTPQEIEEAASMQLREIKSLESEFRSKVAPGG